MQVESALFYTTVGYLEQIQCLLMCKGVCLCIKIFPSCMLVGHFWVFLRSSINTHIQQSTKKSLSSSLSITFPFFPPPDAVCYCNADKQKQKWKVSSTFQETNSREKENFFWIICFSRVSIFNNGKLKLYLPLKLLHNYVHPKIFKLYDAWKKTELNWLKLSIHVSPDKVGH